MSTININDGATSVTVTGGSDEEFISVPSQGASQKYVSTSDTTPGQADQVLLSARVGSVQTNVKDKRTLRITETVIDQETGDVRYNTVRVELSLDARDTLNAYARLLYRAADAMSRSSMENFWKFGSI